MEQLTDELETKTYEYFRQLDELGGMVRALELGYPQREIGEAAYRYQRKLETGDETIVGVNAYKANEEAPIDILLIDEKTEREQIARVQALRHTRDNEALAQALRGLVSAAQGQANLMPFILACVRSYGTIGEISDVLRTVWGTYEEPTAAFSSV